LKFSIKQMHRPPRTSLHRPLTGFIITVARLGAESATWLLREAAGGRRWAMATIHEVTVTSFCMK